MRQWYKDFNFRKDTLALIDTMNAIIVSYQQDGHVLTVRQLYYQLVFRNYIPNTEKSYKKVTGVVNDARLAGFIDWDAIEDRTREFIDRGHWGSGGHMLRNVANQFHMDMWESQDCRIFVVVEKEALAGVLEKACHKWDIPVLAARGYPSGTVLREFAQDRIINCGQNIVILHLGDHDPSGIDMSRDLEERMGLFSEADRYGKCIEFDRIALSMDQIEELKPPPNPAKSTDSRFADYRRKYGSSSWELDALPPTYIEELIDSHVESYVDNDLWEARETEIAGIKTRLAKVAKDFDKDGSNV